MKKTFLASLCYKGAHGGGLFITDEFLAFRTNKLQLPKEMKFIQIPYTDIKNVSSCSSLYLFPSILLTLNNGSSYKFIVFNREKCLRLINEKLQETADQG